MTSNEERWAQDVKMALANQTTKGLLGEYLRNLREEAWIETLIWGGFRGSFRHLLAGDELVVQAAWVRDGYE
jgi:hypothetical protein